MASTDRQTDSPPPRCNASKLAGYGAAFKHWGYQRLEPAADVPIVPGVEIRPPGAANRIPPIRHLLLPIPAK
jgi:hypothetical protein